MKENPSHSGTMPAITIKRAVIGTVLSATLLCSCLFGASAGAEQVKPSVSESGEGSSALAKLSLAEELYFGHITNDPSQENRLNILERALYGRSRSGSFDKRMSRIDEALGLEKRLHLKQAGAASQEPPALTEDPPRKSNDVASTKSADPIQTTDATRRPVSNPNIAGLNKQESGSAVAGGKEAAAVTARSNQDSSSAVAGRNKEDGSIIAGGSKPAGSTMAGAKSGGQPTPAQILLKQGMAAHRSGNHQFAEDRFKRALALDPGNADAFFNLGALAETRGDLLGALTNYRAALGINPLDRQLQDAVHSLEQQIAGHRDTVGSANPQQINSVSGKPANFPSGSTAPTAGGQPKTSVNGAFTAANAPVFNLANVAQDPAPTSTSPGVFNLQTSSYGTGLYNQTPVYGVNQSLPPVFGVNQQAPPIYNVAQMPPPIVPVGGVPHCPICQPQPPAPRGLIGTFLSIGGGMALGPLHCPICRMSHMGW